MTELLRLPEVIKATGLKKTRIYNDIRESVFPSPISLGGRAVAWPSNEIEALNKARIAGASVEELRMLVLNFELSRKAAV